MNTKLRVISLTISLAWLAGVAGCATTSSAAPKAERTAAQAPAAPAASAYSTDATPIGELLDNPKTRAVLDQHIPSFSTAPQVDMARSMTLKGIQPYALDTITDEVLAKVDAAFAAIPAP